jgi:short-subunit dehydrogenase
MNPTSRPPRPSRIYAPDAGSSRRRDLRDARCLVTGASSGLGRAIALALGNAGCQVVLNGRSADRLDQSARALIDAGRPPSSVATVVADLTSESDRARLLDAVSTRFAGSLDVLVNAAGVGAYGRFESHSPTVLRELFEINFFALAELTRGALPLLRRGRAPSVVNIGSIVARRGLPGRSEYSAAKFALAALSESLRAEWAKDGIHVLLVNPGFTATPFEDHLLVNTAIYQTSSNRSMSAERVALATLRALRRGRHEITLTSGGRLLLLVNRLFPRFVDFGFSLWTRRLYSDLTALHRAEGRSVSADCPKPTSSLQSSSSGD